MGKTVKKSHSEERKEPYKPVYLKGEAVERVDTHKYLGVVFDSKLNWNENINSVLKSELENVLHEKAKIIWSKFR